MDINQLKKNVEKELEKGLVARSLDLLIDFLSVKGLKEEINQVIVVKSKWTSTEKDYKIFGSISKSEYDIAYGKTIQAIQVIITSIDHVTDKPKSDIITAHVQKIINPILLTGFIFSFILIGFYLVLKNFTLKPLEKSNDNQEKSKKDLNLLNPVEVSNKPLKKNNAEQITESSTSSKNNNQVGLILNIKENESILFELITHLKKEGKTPILVNKSDSAEYNHLIIGEIVVTKSKEEQKVFGAIVVNYRISFVLKFINTKDHSICNSRYFSTIVEANEFDSDSKVLEQGMYEIYKNFYLGDDFYSCK